MYKEREKKNIKFYSQIQSFFVGVQKKYLKKKCLFTFCRCCFSLWVFHKVLFVRFISCICEGKMVFSQPRLFVFFLWLRPRVPFPVWCTPSRRVPARCSRRWSAMDRPTSPSRLRRHRSIHAHALCRAGLIRVRRRGRWKETMVCERYSGRFWWKSIVLSKGGLIVGRENVFCRCRSVIRCLKRKKELRQ